VIAILVPALLALTVSFPLQDASPSSQSATAAKSSGSFDQLVQDANRAREENRDAAAIDGYRQALQLKPGWDEGLWYLGTLLYEKENYFEACATLRRFLAQNPENSYGLAMLGLSEYESRDYARSLDHLQQSMVLGLGDNKKMKATVNYVIAILLTRSERFDESMTLLLLRVASGEAASQLIEPLGLAALRMPFLPAEIPTDRREMVRIAGEGTLALEEQRYADADKLFSQLEAAYPDQPGVHFLIGVHILGTRPEDGIKELKREIEISPSHVPARLRLADEFIKQQDVDKGISYAQEALKLAPKDSSVHMVLGEGLVAKGDSAAGIRELETARDESPDMVRIRWDLVRAYAAAGRTADASREKGEIERLSKQDAAR
jgi:predicted Zn-dependent protease